MSHGGFRVAGVLGHQRYSPSAAPNGPWLGGGGALVWPQHDVPDVYGQCPVLANPMLAVGPGGLPKAAAVAAFLRLVECTPSDGPKPPQVASVRPQAVRALLKAWGNSGTELTKPFLDAFVLDKRFDGTIERATLLKNIKPGATEFRRWLEAVLALPVHCDLALGLLALGAVKPEVAEHLLDGKDASRAGIEACGKLLRIDPGAYALAGGGQNKASATAIVAAAVRVLELHHGPKQPVNLESYSTKLHAALNISNAVPAAVGRGLWRHMQCRGCVRLPARSAPWRKMLLNSDWAVYALDGAADSVPLEAVRAGLFVAVADRLYSTALLSVLWAVDTGALQIVLYPTIGPFTGRPRKIDHHLVRRVGADNRPEPMRFPCTWLGDLAAPRVTPARAIAGVADGLTWAAIGHAAAKGVRTIMLAGHTPTAAAAAAAGRPSAWLDLLYTHGEYELWHVSVGRTLIDAAQATRVLTASDKRLVAATSMYAMTRDYQYVKQIQEALAAAGIKGAGTGADEAAMPLATAVDLAQNIAAADPPAAKRPRSAAALD